jgi:hypothetical protein
MRKSRIHIKKNEYFIYMSCKKVIINFIYNKINGTAMINNHSSFIITLLTRKINKDSIPPINEQDWYLITTKYCFRYFCKSKVSSN